MSLTTRLATAMTTVVIVIAGYVVWMALTIGAMVGIVKHIRFWLVGTIIVGGSVVLCCMEFVRWRQNISQEVKVDTRYRTVAIGGVNLKLVFEDSVYSEVSKDRIRTDLQDVFTSHRNSIIEPEPNILHATFVVRGLPVYAQYHLRFSHGQELPAKLRGALFANEDESTGYLALLISIELQNEYMKSITIVEKFKTEIDALPTSLHAIGTMSVMDPKMHAFVLRMNGEDVLVPAEQIQMPPLMDLQNLRSARALNNGLLSFETMALSGQDVLCYSTASASGDEEPTTIDLCLLDGRWRVTWPWL